MSCQPTAFDHENFHYDDDRLRSGIQWRFYEGAPEFGLAPNLPLTFVHSAYNVPYTTGVVSTKVV